MFCVEHSTDQLSAPCPAAKLVPIGFGIRKLQITAVIEDAKVESMDSILEEELVRDGESETIQSADIAAFNKLLGWWPPGGGLLLWHGRVQVPSGLQTMHLSQIWWGLSFALPVHSTVQLADSPSLMVPCSSAPAVSKLCACASAQPCAC